MMKKLLSKLLLIGIFVGFTIQTAFAEHYKYYVYNHKDKEVYQGILLTDGLVNYTGTGKAYYYAFASQNGMPICLIKNINGTNVKNNLIGGECIDYFAIISRVIKGENIDLSDYIWEWRETTPGSLKKEVEAIKKERTSQGMYEYKGDWYENLQKNMSANKYILVKPQNE